MLSYVLGLLLLIFLCLNFHVFLLMRKYRASVKYLEKEFERFAEDAESRITTHQNLIEQTRDEFRAMAPDQVVNQGVFSRGEEQ